MLVVNFPKCNTGLNKKDACFWLWTTINVDPVGLLTTVLGFAQTYTQLPVNINRNLFPRP